MKTPLTITVSCWTFCFNSCPWCVSGSNLDKWQYNGNFEQFSPPGFDHLNNLQIRELFGPDYYNRLCPDKTRWLNKADILDFDCLLLWLTKFTPAAQIHVSGGEPLLRPDIENQIEKLLNAGFRTTVFTNGMLIDKRPRLADMPLTWVIAHHPPNDINKWRQNVDLVCHQRIFTTRVLYRDDELKQKDSIRNLYTGLPFFFSNAATRKKEVDIPFNPDDLGCIASEVLHLIVPDGRVYRCNNDKSPPIGNIMSNEYYPEIAKTSDNDARQCVKSGLCPAYISALMTK